MATHPLFQIVLRAERHRLDPVLRLPALLRRAWRGHALQCMSILPLNSKELFTMKSISDRFPSRFKTATDFKQRHGVGGRKTLTVDHTSDEEFDDGEKLVVWFKGDPQGYVVRRPSVARNLGASLGDDPSTWVGKRVTLYLELLKNGGHSLVAVADGKFREERRPPTPEEVAVAAQQPIDDADADPIP